MVKRYQKCKQLVSFALVGLILVGLYFVVSADELLQDGSFEDCATYWTGSASCTGGLVRSGSYAAEFTGGTSDYIEQQVSVPSGASNQSVRFYCRTDSDHFNRTLELFVGGVSQGTFACSYSGWSYHSVNVDESGSVWVRWAKGGTFFEDIYLDDASYYYDAPTATPTATATETATVTETATEAPPPTQPPPPTATATATATATPVAPLAFTIDMDEVLITTSIVIAFMMPLIVLLIGIRVGFMLVRKVSNALRG